MTRDFQRKWIICRLFRPKQGILPHQLSTIDGRCFGLVFLNCFRNILQTNLREILGFEVLTVVVVKSSIFWYITPCSQFKVNRCFWGICRLHLQSRRISQVWNQHDTACRASRWLTLNRLQGVIYQKRTLQDILYNLDLNDFQEALLVLQNISFLYDRMATNMILERSLKYPELN
jgi:hypothetical protein